MPDFKFGAVVMGNSAGAGGAAMTIIRALMDEILGIPIEGRPSQNTKQKREKNDRKKDLALHSKPHHDDKKESQARSNDEPQTQTLHSDQYGNKGKDSQHKKTQQPQGQKKPTKYEQTPPPPQETPLETYVGTLWNAGYRAMTVTIKNNHLL